MPTYADIKSDIADDIDDTTGEYADQIAAAVLEAIRYCERFPFYFNETRDETFPTINGQEWYDATDNAHIPTAPRIYALYSEDAQGQRTTLTRQRPEELEILSDNSASTGEPYCWTYFNRQIRLYPIPDAEVFTIRMQLGPYRLTTLVDDDDENAWLTEAYDMVKARAKYVLCKDTLKDDAEAIKARAEYEEQKSALDAETSSRTGTGRIVPTQF